MNIKIYTDYENLSFILTITSWNISDLDYGEGFCNDGYIDLDGKVEEIVDITSKDMDIIMELTYDNRSLFNKVCDENLQKIFEIISKLEE